MPPAQVITAELAQFMGAISREIRRQVGVLVDRRGRVQHVIVGDGHKLFLPDLGRHRAGQGRFRGVRLIHTHLGGEPLTRDDLTDLTLLQLDLIGVLQVDDDGRATTLELAHCIPPGPSDVPWEVLRPEPIHDLELHFLKLMDELEERFAAQGAVLRAGVHATRAIAVHVTTGAATEPDVEQSLGELTELAATAGVEIVETVIQRRRELDPRFLIGRGKLDELVLAAMQQGVDLIIFDRDLSPSQVRSIADVTEARVIDRTQLILDIFAQRACTRDGKLQVELAQLKYTLPRLAGKNSAMSRLTGGIGGRGPGETKLEIDRRRAKDRITHLQRQIDQLAAQRQQRRRRRETQQVPVAAIVGYTNAGKSTLLNTLTGADVVAENKLFATLDPTTRRLRFPDERELVLTDTVGFIRALPEDLVAAFKATLEELHDADVLVHVVDVASPGWEDRIHAVDRILRDLGVHEKPRILAFNKTDAVGDRALLATLCRVHEAVPLSALDKSTLGPLTSQLIEALRAVSDSHALGPLPWDPLGPAAPVVVPEPEAATDEDPAWAADDEPARTYDERPARGEGPAEPSWVN